MDFEKSFQRLEEILKKLEAGDLTLEESLELYQEGTTLSVRCKKELETAKQKISEFNIAGEQDDKSE